VQTVFHLIETVVVPLKQNPRGRAHPLPIPLVEIRCTVHEYDDFAVGSYARVEAGRNGGRSGGSGLGDGLLRDDSYDAETEQGEGTQDGQMRNAHKDTCN
jgi:hypothetical protein